MLCCALCYAMHVPMIVYDRRILTVQCACTVPSFYSSKLGYKARIELSTRLVYEARIELRDTRLVYEARIRARRRPSLYEPRIRALARIRVVYEARLRAV